MSARVIEEWYMKAGSNQAGELVDVPLARVLAIVPGERGDLMYVVIGSDFCWVKGLPKGEGYKIFKYRLAGPESSWKQQIHEYVEKGFDEEDAFDVVPPGTKTPLSQEGLTIIAE